MELAKRTKKEKFWQCVWVARRWMEVKSLEWDMMMANNPWMNAIDKVEFEEACDDIQVATGDIPHLHKNILLGD